MMKVVTEADLRREKLLEGKKEYQIGADVLLTPSAQEYLRDKEIVFARKKPEDMTHIRGSQLVKKTHPRIRLRGDAGRPSCKGSGPAGQIPGTKAAL